MSTYPVPRQRDLRRGHLDVQRPVSLGDSNQSPGGMPRSRAPSPLPRPHSVPPPTTGTGGLQNLAVTLPTRETLATVMNSSLDAFSDRDKLHWAQDVVRLLDRHLKITSTTTCPPHIEPLMLMAIPIIVSFTSHRSPTLAGSASYLKAHLLSTGSYPDGMPKDPRQAFKDFEVAAKAGESRAWYRLGRDYETCGEEERARSCFQRGARKGDGECLYRMGMAHLMGQLGLPSEPEVAIPLLRRAASLATIDAPQAAYVFGMLLAGEFEQLAVASHILLPPGSQPSQRLATQHSEARALVLRAAYLCFAPAQYKAAYLYEHAQLGCVYDPLLSVQYYSLASQNGEIEADMALSKWFLVGAEGSFDKNEPLARTFAQKAAKAGLASGCFALGYYYELGIGGRADVTQAQIWYRKAAEKGNRDAVARLKALENPSPVTMSPQDHREMVHTRLVRKHTDTRMRSERLQPGNVGRRVVDEREKAEAQRLAHRASMTAPHPMGHSDIAEEVVNGYGSTQSRYASPPQPYVPGSWDRRPSGDDAVVGGSYPQQEYPPTPPQLPSPDLAPTCQLSRQSRPVKPRRGAINGGDARDGRSSGSPSPMILPETSGTLPQDEFELSGGRHQSYALQDPGPVPDGGRPLRRAANSRQNTGAATFEEMGFVSKPVKDEECCIM